MTGTTPTIWARGLQAVLYALALMPVMPYNLNSICMMLFVLLAILHRVQQRKEGTAKAQPGLFWWYSGNFFLFALSLLYSIDLREGFKFMERELPMLLFPLVFFLLPPPVTDTGKRKVLNVFLAGTLLLSVYLLARYSLDGLLQQVGQASSFNTVLRDRADQWTGKHPTYLSLYFSFALVIALERLLTPGSRWEKAVSILALPLCLLPLLLASRTPVVATVLGMFLYLIQRIRDRAWRIGLPLGLLVLSAVFVRFTPGLYSRVQESLNTRLQTPEGSGHNSTNIRVGIFQCTKEGIRQRPLLGWGAGSDKKVLNDCYRQFPTDAYTITFYNTHNQYGHFWLTTGLIGLLWFLIALFMAFRTSIRRKDWVMAYFLLICSIGFLTENLLSRQAGIVFFYFFLCLFLAPFEKTATPAPGADREGKGQLPVV